MKTETIMPTNFMGQTAKIIAEMRARTCMDYVDTEVLEVILQNALDTVHNRAYDDGYDIGYGIGYDVGHKHGHSAVQE